jgi:hypothetical protein
MKSMVVFLVVTILCVAGLSLAQSLPPGINITEWNSSDSHHGSPPTPFPKQVIPNNPKPIPNGAGPSQTTIDSCLRCKEDCKKLYPVSGMPLWDCYGDCMDQWYGKLDPRTVPTQPSKMNYSPRAIKGCEQCEANCGRMYQTPLEVSQCEIKCMKDWYGDPSK